MPHEVWRLHLDGLIESQLPSGSWSYFPRQRGSRPRRTGTFMGLANLEICRQALRTEIAADPDLAERLRKSRVRVMAAGVGADGPERRR